MERFLTVFWLLLIPTQLGKHFWLKESSVMGVRVDYLSIIFYLTDIVWFLWVMYQLRIKNYRLQVKKLLNFQNFILLLFVVVNIIFAQAKWVALYKWLRVGQWWLTWRLVANKRKKIVEYLKWIVPGWIILESFLGLAQIINGGSLNGIWWWLGERRFTYGGIGIAQIRFFDEGWIRAYGTFSHPNSLAGFLLLAWWWFRQQFRSYGGEGYSKRIFYWVVNWSALMGIVLTGSRVVWTLSLGLLVVEQFKKIKPTLPSLNKEEKNKYLKTIVGKILFFGGIVTLMLGVISINYRISDFVGGWDVDSFQKREMLAGAAIRMIEKYPLFGVGAGNFVVNLPEFQRGNFYWRQPVHNIFLLIWSEVGILGIMMLVASYQLLISDLSKSKVFRWIKKYWWIWVIVGVSGMLDHYWLTLPQNSWLLAIILGLI